MKRKECTPKTNTHSQAHSCADRYMPLVLKRLHADGPSRVCLPDYVLRRPFIFPGPVVRGQRALQERPSALVGVFSRSVHANPSCLRCRGADALSICIVGLVRPGIAVVMTALNVLCIRNEER